MPREKENKNDSFPNNITDEEKNQTLLIKEDKHYKRFKEVLKALKLFLRL